MCIKVFRININNNKFSGKTLNFLFIFLLLFTQTLILNPLISASNDNNESIESEFNEKESKNLGINKEIQKVKNSTYTNYILNNSFQFNLESDSVCNTIHFNFTDINETRNFINNGDFESDIVRWDAENKTDINYTWINNGPDNSKCIHLNLTGKDSQNKVRPMNNSLGVENFRELDGWTHLNNDQDNFTIEHSAFKGHNHSVGDNSGCLMQQYDGDLGETGMANSTYEFFYDSSFPIITSELSFWYFSEFLTIIESNTIIASLYLITPKKAEYRLWKTTIIDGDLSDFTQKKILNLNKYFNESGSYNITLISEHVHNKTNTYSKMYFDDIELNITQGYNVIDKDEILTWNQSIYFERNVYQNAIFNISFFIPDIFNHINSSDVFVTFWINNQKFIIDSVQNVSEGKWINASMEISKAIIDSIVLNVSIGLYFNTTTYIFKNESFSIFFDNVSLIIGTHPRPKDINLSIYILELKKFFKVERDLYNHDFVKVFNESFVWESNTIYTVNITTNASVVRVNFIATYFITQTFPDKNGVDDNKEEKPKELNILLIILIIILILSISSFLFIIRIEKRLFLNPKYDYIKKLNIKKRIKEQKIYSEKELKKRCTSCGRIINERAKFCEHCGKVQ
ncbi:MAG: hypothetical protein ACTSR8_15350 [Promethearchaeota archaeon]